MIDFILFDPNFSFNLCLFSMVSVIFLSGYLGLGTAL